LPGQLRRIGPHGFEVVIAACVRLKEVYDQVDAVDDDPGRLVVGTGAVDALGAFLDKVLDLVRDGADLPFAGAGGQDEEVLDFAELADVKDDDIGALEVAEQACDLDGENLGVWCVAGCWCRARGGVGGRIGLLAQRVAPLRER